MRFWVGIALALGMLPCIPASSAWAVTVTFGLPTLGTKRTGPPQPPAIASEPKLRVAAGVGGGSVNVATDLSTRYVAVVEGSEALVRAIDGSAPDVFLRPPVAASGRTLIASVAMSADGSTVALGWSSEKSASIFLFDRASGAVIRRIDGPVDVVSDMRFSPDGSTIAAALSSGGVQLFNARTGAEIGRDLNYGGRGYSLDISADGQLLVTTCSDRAVRLYSLQLGSLRLLGSTVTGSNMFQTAPSSARFSPDGTLLVVSFDRGADVEIWSTATLKKTAMLWTIGLSNALSVAWSPDGTRIYAPSANGKGEFKMRVWTSRPSVKPQDEGFNILSKDEDLLVENHGGSRGFVPLADGGLLVFTKTGAWGRFDAQGALSWPTESRPVRYSSFVLDISKRLPLLLSPDGKTVEFADGYKVLGTFNTVQRSFDAAPGPLAAAITQSSFDLKVSITGIFGLSNPTKRATLNGVPLPMPSKEYATSYAISPDGQQIAVATSGAIRMYSRTGVEVWSQQGGAVAVNISKDGRVVVVDDGVIRWLRASDGAPLLNLLSSADRSRWALWTPSGYYEASAGGDDMVEWQVNRGLDRPADVFPLSRFADVMRRPDVVSRVLDTLDESAAVDQANIAAGRRPERLADLSPALPSSQQQAGRGSGPGARSGFSRSPGSRPAKSAPRGAQFGAAAMPKTDAPMILETTVINPQIVARILPPVLDPVLVPTSFSSASVTIRYRVRTPPDAPMIGEPRVLVNGQWQPRSRAVSQVAPDVRTLVISGLPPHDSLIELYADNHNGTSTPLAVNLKWVGQGGAATAPVTPAARKPRLFVLAIGVAQYARPELRLNFADHDAEQLVSAMAGQQGRAYASVTTKLILNGQATHSAVVAGLQWLQSQTAADDVGLLFLAGHGLQTSDGYYFFAPADFDPSQPRETGVNYKLIREALVGFEGKGNTAVFLIDTCYSGGALGTNNIASSGQSFGLTLTGEAFSMVGMTSSGRQQLSLEKAEWGDGAFTKALIEGIVDGRADAAGSGEITMLGLGSYVSERVKKLTLQAQTPVFMAPTGLQDFAIAVH